MIVASGAEFETCFESGITGLVGTVAVQVIDNDGLIVIAPSTDDIIETPISSGIYCTQRTGPVATGQYTIVWSDDGSFTDAHVAVEELIIVAADAPTLPPILAPEVDGYAGGPCRAWTTAEDAAAFCGDASSDASDFDDPVRAAGEVLFEASGRQFLGLCEETSRPCTTNDFCGVQVLSRGHVVVWDGSVWVGDTGPQPACTCSGVSRVLLGNYPVREVSQVLIDGDVVDPDTYRLDEKRYLTRLRDSEGRRQLWPRCQIIDAPSTEDGTFEVTYTHGQEIPMAGQLAARELACQIHNASPNVQAECKLPSGVTRIARQNVVIDFAGFKAWGQKDGVWMTGLPLVDGFLNAYNPNGLRRRPAIWSPDQAPFPAKVGS